VLDQCIVFPPFDVTPMEVGDAPVEEEFLGVEGNQHWDEVWRKGKPFHQRQRPLRYRLDQK
jgi:hypothetical protein